MTVAPKRNYELEHALELQAKDLIEQAIDKVIKFGPKSITRELTRLRELNKLKDFVVLVSRKDKNLATEIIKHCKGI